MFFLSFRGRDAMAVGDVMFIWCDFSDGLVFVLCCCFCSFCWILVILGVFFQFDYDVGSPCILLILYKDIVMLIFVASFTVKMFLAPASFQCSNNQGCALKTFLGLKLNIDLGQRIFQREIGPFSS